MDSEKFGRFIAERRKAKGMTQLALASALHITDKAVSKWERGLSNPDIGLLTQLADILDVSVNDLLRGECTEETADHSDIGEVLIYAEKSVQRKFSSMKTACAVGFTVLMLLGLIICAVIDAAITGRLTWSLYPISSIIFAWCVLFPVIRAGRKGVLLSLISLTVLIVPYLFVLDIISGSGGSVVKAGGVVSVIVLAFLWACWFIIRKWKGRVFLAAGLCTALAAPVCVLINYSLSLTLTPEAAAFDVWDVLDIVILLACGLALLLIDLYLQKKNGT